MARSIQSELITLREEVRPYGILHGLVELFAHAPKDGAFRSPKEVLEMARLEAIKNAKQTEGILVRLLASNKLRRVIVQQANTARVDVDGQNIYKHPLLTVATGSNTLANLSLVSLEEDAISKVEQRPQLVLLSTGEAPISEDFNEKHIAWQHSFFTIINPDAVPSSSALLQCGPRSQREVGETPTIICFASSGKY